MAAGLQCLACQGFKDISETSQALDTVLSSRSEKMQVFCAAAWHHAAWLNHPVCISQRVLSNLLDMRMHAECQTAPAVTNAASSPSSRSLKDMAQPRSGSGSGSSPTLKLRT